MPPFALYLYGPAGGPLLDSFEQASERLQTLERLYWEPDGSFSWVPDPVPGHRVDGMLYDAADRLQYVDLKGTCSLVAWQTLIATLCPPTHTTEPCMVLHLRNGVWQQLHHFEREQWGGPDQQASSANR